MKEKRGLVLENMHLPFIKHGMKRRDKELFIESVTLVVIYLFSFGILSLGRVRQEFFGISEDIFSNIQIFSLTFFFAVAITLIIYFLYKKTVQ